MGGFGSGRRARHRRKTTVEQCTVLNVPTCGKNSPLKITPWEIGSLGETRIDHCFGITEGMISYTFSVEVTKQHISGYRFWFLCPGCDKRCGKLYRPPGKQEYLCRNCHQLTYRSSQTSHCKSLYGRYPEFKKCRIAGKSKHH